MKRILAITIVLAGFAMLLGFGVTAATEASNNLMPASNEPAWNMFVEHTVFFEVVTDAGHFEMEFWETVDSDDETERFLEICLPHYEGFICEEVEVDEEDMEVDFGFPLRDSTARIEADVEGCGVIDLDIVLSPDQGYETVRSMQFSPDGYVVGIVDEVEVHAEETIIGEDVTGVFCGLLLSTSNVIEASHGMAEKNEKEREED